jgi:23S rRNA-/tRNA-specific pseudouridylate synthase
LEEAPKIEIPIILEKEDYMVINKPKWVLSHPNSVWEANCKRLNDTIHF